MIHLIYVLVSVCCLIARTLLTIVLLFILTIVLPFDLQRVSY